MTGRSGIIPSPWQLAAALQPSPCRYRTTISIHKKSRRNGVRNLRSLIRIPQERNSSDAPLSSEHPPNHKSLKHGVLKSFSLNHTTEAITPHQCHQLLFQAVPPVCLQSRKSLLSPDIIPRLYWRDFAVLERNTTRQCQKLVYTSLWNLPSRRRELSLPRW